MSYRTERFNSLLQQEISDILQRHIKDPRLGSFISVTAVEVSPDLRYAKVLVSNMGSPEEKQHTIQALTSAAGYIRRELGERIKARHIPELSFRIDETIEKADRVLRLIDRISEEESSHS
jgi:ribosome-binding factor A